MQRNNKVHEFPVGFFLMLLLAASLLGVTFMSTRSIKPKTKCTCVVTP